MNTTDAECRKSFDKEYGLINQLARKSTGEYEEWNLELTWKCWEKAWQTCRAVVERVNGERTDKTYTDFMHEWIRRRNNGSNDQPEAAKESVWSWVKWAWEIAATTERHGKDGK